MDLISRQAAIESVYAALQMPSGEHEWKRVRDGLLALPTIAEPEIIRCKDCAWMPLPDPYAADMRGEKHE